MTKSLASDSDEIKIDIMLLRVQTFGDKVTYIQILQWIMSGKTSDHDDPVE